MVWLPPAPQEQVTDASGLQLFSVSVTTLNPEAVVSVPVTIDAPGDEATSTLSDLENSGYRLRRIVGKIFAFGDRFDTVSGIEAVAITAGLMVRRVGVDGVAIATDQQRNPQIRENWGDPWIWRRTWILFNPELASPFPERLPLNNTDYGSAVDGAHLDQKTARIVAKEERLFLDVAATVVLSGGQAELTNDTLIITDLRCLASMVTSSGNRRNSSR